jgi:hypothetical protein
VQFLDKSAPLIDPLDSDTEDDPEDEDEEDSGAESDCDIPPPAHLPFRMKWRSFLRSTLTRSQRARVPSEALQKKHRYHSYHPALLRKWDKLVNEDKLVWIADNHGQELALKMQRMQERARGPYQPGDESD